MHLIDPAKHTRRAFLRRAGQLAFTGAALPTAMNLAAIGEAEFGAGKGIDLFACVFVGTGIGGALMVNGARYGGAAGTAGEIGHMMVRAGGRLCGCGQRGHLEAYASRTAMVAMMREAVEGGDLDRMYGRHARWPIVVAARWQDQPWPSMPMVSPRGLGLPHLLIV